MVFITRNNSFRCENCGREVDKAERTCRNHCPYCLWSKHVDEIGPGDRMSMCQGLMKPISLEQSGKKGFVIIHQCVKCGKTIKNLAASDDDLTILMS